MDDPTAVICRTNDTALKMALSDRSKCRRAGLCMDAKELIRGVDNLERFKQRGVSEAKRFARFNSYDELLEAIENGDAPDLKILLSVVDDYGFDGARQILSELAVGKKPDEIAASGASTLYLTGHASKGLQFDRIRLGDDFKGGEKLEALPNKKEELNILYVAASALKQPCVWETPKGLLISRRFWQRAMSAAWLMGGHTPWRLDAPSNRRRVRRGTSAVFSWARRR